MKKHSGIGNTFDKQSVRIFDRDNDRDNDNENDYVNENATLGRRRFVKVCAGFAAAVSSAPAQLPASTAPRREFNRVRLMKSVTEPMKLADINQATSYVFTYPYAETPCFLLDLGRKTMATDDLQTADGRDYESIDGLGQDTSIVAFSAICTHKLSHPAKAISFIDYRADKTSYMNHDFENKSQSNIIYCCSERSAYDPAKGGKVLGGPATEPLTTIVLEHDESEESIYATATIGGDIFDRFFEKFGPRLSLEYGSEDYLKPVETEVVVRTLDEYSAASKTC